MEGGAGQGHGSVLRGGAWGQRNEAAERHALRAGGCGLRRGVQEVGAYASILPTRRSLQPCPPRYGRPFTAHLKCTITPLAQHT